MNETKKLNSYRLAKGYDKYFSGQGIDIGCGPDPLDPKVFTSIASIKTYDRVDGDAQTCSNLQNESFDFAYSSHCLEHLPNPKEALQNWIRITKPGGHIVVAVPHEIYYEKNLWPSRFNSDHKVSFRMEPLTIMPRSINVFDLVKDLPAELVSCELLLHHFDFSHFWKDQTLGDAVCQIEFILRKN